MYKSGGIMWLHTQQKRIKRHILRNIKTVMKHGQYIMGPEVRELERVLSEYVGAHYAVACSSGTDAILLALMAHGVDKDFRIFTTPFTFISTAEVAALLGAKIHFVDIDPVTFNIDPVKLERAIKQYSETSNIGVIAVDLFGIPADYKSINEIARRYGGFVIEDAAQSFGGSMQGKMAGSLASIGCTSFFPSKPLGCYGDGGMCFTDDLHLFEMMDSIRIHGKGLNKYQNQRIGLNARLDTLQAAILLAKFKIFQDELQKRQEIASEYYFSFMECGMNLILPRVPEGFKSAWAQYSILAENEMARDSFRNKLENQEIETNIYYPTPLHLQEAFKYLNYREGDFPISESCAKRIFTIPMHPYVKKSEQERLVEVMK